MRTALIFTLFVAAACGYLGRKVEQKRRERAAVEAIAKLGGEIAWNYQRVKGQRGQWHPAGAEAFGPAWLRAILGDNFISDVDHIVCVAGVENLNDFTRLPSLHLLSGGVTDNGLDAVKGLKELRTLALIDTKVSDAAVQDLHAALPNCYIMVIHQFPTASRKDYPPISAGEPSSASRCNRLCE